MNDLSGFHAGELAVQQRAGVGAAAARLAGMLEPPDLGRGAGRFLAERTFAALTAHDRGGRLWITPVTGPPGFLEAIGLADLRVHTMLAVGDPLHDLPPGQQVGMLAVEFARRRRIRVNGTLTAADRDGLTIRVDQAYGNCPSYIRPRTLEPAGPEAVVPVVRHGDALTAADVDLVRRTDTFLLGTTHPDRGADASHRGGPAGFLRVTDERTLWWPDYPGNNMFNSLGNLAVDPAAALLVVDFATGDTLHLSGTAQVDWTATGADDEGGTGRRVRFAVEALVAGPPIALRAGDEPRGRARSRP
ncbi:pyridoxamine 5'-phosphate oxidase family protein [Pseudonocardia lutea]|uniref:Pyridoxamine 5'-phosphate oxidase family protein n=1 Tax=Pseudonocardia lutea TaxID=2172015 RepID=A0ABW1IIN7_9PSEU